MVSSLTHRVDDHVGLKRSDHEGAASLASEGRGIQSWRKRLSAGLKAGVWRWMGFEIASRAERAQWDASLADAHANAAIWKARAKAWASRVEVLENRVAESQLVAIDLRARLVCLHGKLATTAATARYQAFTTALEGEAQNH